MESRALGMESWWFIYININGSFVKIGRENHHTIVTLSIADIIEIGGHQILMI